MKEYSRYTEYQQRIQERNREIVRDYKDMISNGFMKTAAYKALRDKYGFSSTTAVYNILKNANDGDFVNP